MLILAPLTGHKRRGMRAVPAGCQEAMGHEGFPEAGPLLDSGILLAIVFLFFLFKEE